MSARHIRIAVLTLSAILASAGPAAAVSSCKVKIDPKDGTILISAGKITGTLNWGPSTGSITRSFFDPSCVSGGKAKNCVLGDVGTAARITPPERCTIFLGDGTSTCSVFLKSCTPGTREGQFPVARMELNDGDSNVTLLTISGIGVLQASCAAGVATTRFVNHAGTAINLEAWGVDNGSPDAAFVQRTNPADGGAVSQANNGTGGVHAVEWQASFSDGNGRAHVITAAVTAGADGSNCVVTAHAITND